MREGRGKGNGEAVDSPLPALENDHMPLPATIQPSVDQALIGRVTRLYNGTLTDALLELFQNGRRAGAHSLDVNVFDRQGTHYLSIYDDGRGIDDPNALLSLGRSGWDAQTASREDPAGMGVFSLAGRDVVIRSYSKTAKRGWMVSIPADGWETANPLPIGPSSILRGTQFEIAMPQAWADQAERAVSEAARFYPLPVRFNGAHLPREDFLAKAHRVEVWNGCRIGIYLKHPSTILEPRINFHGVTVCCSLPEVREIGPFGPAWTARVEIVDAPHLQLVLPARKEMVSGPALDDLRTAVRTAIYRAIAEEGQHRLSHNHWLRASELGIMLPEAEPWLHAWIPDTGERENLAGEPVRDVPMGVIDRFDCDIEQAAARILGVGEPLGFRIVTEETCFEGYSWYDALPRIADIGFTIEKGDATIRYDSNGLVPDTCEQGMASRITMDVALRSSADNSDAPTVQSFPLDMLVCLNDHSELCETTIFIREQADVTPDELVSFLEACCFYYCDDSDCDSWDTQYRNFSWEARSLATNLLLGDEAAMLERLRTAIRDELLWLIPEGRRIEVSATSKDMTLAFIDPA